VKPTPAITPPPATQQSSRVAIVVSRYNEAITRRLCDGAVATLEAGGVGAADVEVFHVPGAFELAFAADRLAAGGRYAAVICLGAIIRGETIHDRVIAAAVAAGIESSARTRGVPIAFGVLTCDTLAQASARAGGNAGNKGREAAEAALGMMAFVAGLPSPEASR
jgi:6,7-dimethyl-8-ribityllumazine synthase